MVVFVKAIKSLAIAIAALPFAGCAVAVGIIFGALLRAESYAPDMGNVLFTRAMLGFALVETFALFIMLFGSMALIL